MRFMNLLKRIFTFNNRSVLLIIIVFCVVHALLINVNKVEWGDTYRILRSSEYIKSFSYPADEKRPPLFSALISLNSNVIDPLLFGKIIVFAFSLGSLIVLYNWLKKYTSNNKFVYLGLLLFIFNPVYLYWSIRVYADVVFSFWSLLVLYLYTTWRKQLDYKKLVFIGLLCGLAILTRFEGYVLTASVLLALLLENLKHLKQMASSVFMLCTGLVAVALPWLIYRNPLTSSYFEEPSRRVYDLNMVLTFLVSLAFSFGFVYAIALIAGLKNDLIILAKNNLAPTFFCVFELILILFWPAAIPRLFIPIIPWAIILIALGVERHFTNSITKYQILIYSVLLLVYIWARFKLNLQFFIPIKTVFMLVIALQIVILIAMFKKWYTIFAITTITSCAIWGISTIYLHRNVLISVKSAAEYASQNLIGIIGYNDTNAVSDWYLNYQYKITVTDN